MTADPSPTDFPHRHLLGIEGLSPGDIGLLLDIADGYVAQNRRVDKKTGSLRGRTLINLFFESSTRTRTSFELAGKRLGADVINMSVGSSSIKKGETLIDTAMTLNAMHPDVLVVRHPDSGAVQLLSEKVNCAVINAGDGSHEHPTQALLDALTIRRRVGGLTGLTVAICGDIMHSRVARSNIHLFNIMGARVRLVAPPTLLLSLAGTITLIKGRGEGAWAWSDPTFHCLVLSVLVFALGGVLGLFVDGADTRTPAHYHGVIGGINLAFYGLFYSWFLPALAALYRAADRREAGLPR